MAIKIESVNAVGIRLSSYASDAPPPDGHPEDNPGELLSWVTANDLGAYEEGTDVSIQMNCTNAVSYALHAAAQIPPGLSLSPTGVLSGTLGGLSVESVRSFSIRATAADNTTLTRQFSMTVTMSSPPTWTTPAGSLGTVNERVESTLSVSATHERGVTYSSVGAMPSGWAVNASTGAITGKGPGVVGQTTFDFTLRATNNAGKSADRGFSITVNDTQLSMFVLSSSTQTRASSLDDGASWTKVNDSGASSVWVRGALTDTVATGHRFYRRNSGNYLRSNDGASWVSITPTPSYGQNGARYLNGAWRFAGLGGSSPNQRWFWDIAYNGTTYVAVGAAQTGASVWRGGIWTATTYDANPASANWTQVHTSSASGTSGSSYRYSQVVFFNGVCYVFAANSNVVGASSSNLTTWSNFTGIASDAYVVTTTGDPVLLYAESGVAIRARNLAGSVTSYLSHSNVRSLGWNGLPMGQGGVAIAGYTNGNIYRTTSPTFANWASGIQTSLIDGDVSQIAGSY